MHVIIIGAGEVGYELAESIRRKGHDIVIVDRDEHACQRVRDLDIKVIKGNGARPELLNSLDIRSCDFFFAVTDDNETNLVTCALAKSSRTTTIARINGLEYINNPVSKRFSKIGVDYAVSTEMIIAQEISNIISVPSAINMNIALSGKINVLEFKILEHSKVEGKKLKNIRLPPKVNLGGIIRDKNVLIPHGNTVLKEGDTLIVMTGGKSEIRQMMKLIGKRRRKINSVMIVGATDIGINIAKILERRKIRVILLEVSRNRARTAAEVLKETEVIVGDARDKRILIEEGILRVDAFASCTPSEEFNVLVSLLAKIYGVEKTIAVVRELGLKSLIETVGIDMAASPQLQTARMMLRLTRELNPLKAISFHGGDLYLLETMVDEYSSVLGDRLEDVDLPEGTLVGAIIRDDHTIIPHGKTILKKGDQVMIFVLKEDIEKVEEIF